MWVCVSARTQKVSKLHEIEDMPVKQNSFTRLRVLLVLPDCRNRCPPDKHCVLTAENAKEAGNDCYWYTHSLLI
jgi:hypothetical protein